MIFVMVHVFVLPWLTDDGCLVVVSRTCQTAEQLIMMMTLFWLFEVSYKLQHRNKHNENLYRQNVCKKSWGRFTWQYNVIVQPVSISAYQSTWKSGPCFLSVIEETGVLAAVITQIDEMVLPYLICIFSDNFWHSDVRIIRHRLFFLHDAYNTAPLSSVPSIFLVFIFFLLLSFATFLWDTL